MKSMQKGFTLIELMIVVAIIAILAAIAIPAYQNYVIRSKVTEAMSQLDSAKTGVAEFYQSNGHIPASAASAGFDETAAGGGQISNYVLKLTYTAGTGSIDATTQNTGAAAADTPVVTMTPFEQDGTTALPAAGGYAGPIVWKCTSSPASAAKYVPATCRN